MAEKSELKLVEVSTGAEFDVTVDGLDVFFPNHVNGWSDVLDCRIPPYKTQPLEEVCEFAAGVRKEFVLVIPQS